MGHRAFARHVDQLLSGATDAAFSV
jgi:hypothetical protein